MPGDKPVLYEMMYIVDPNVGDEGIEKAIANVNSEITNLGGVIEKENRWGQRRLAYTIKKRNEGYYVVVEYTLPPSKHKDLLSALRITLEILRFLSLKVPKAKLLQDEHDAKMLKKRAAAAQARAEEEASRTEEANRSSSVTDSPAVETPAAPAAADVAPQEVPAEDPPAEVAAPEEPVASETAPSEETAAPEAAPVETPEEEPAADEKPPETPA